MPNHTMPGLKSIIALAKPAHILGLITQVLPTPVLFIPNTLELYLMEVPALFSLSLADGRVGTFQSGGDDDCKISEITTTIDLRLQNAFIAFSSSAKLHRIRKYRLAINDKGQFVGPVIAKRHHRHRARQTAKEITDQEIGELEAWSKLTAGSDRKVLQAEHDRIVQEMRQELRETPRPPM